MSEPHRFLFITCQLGAEQAVKSEMSRRLPEFRFAFSRPGFLTFKLPENHQLPDDFDPNLVFARTLGFSLGKAVGGDLDHRAQSVWEVFGDRPVHAIHVWPRDPAVPGEHEFEPSITPEAIEAHEAIRRHCPLPIAEKLIGVAEAPARRGRYVLDCVLVEPDQWWIGTHRVKSATSRWPGGIMSLTLPPSAVSRAWLKMEEALRWSQLPIAAGARCVEIGSAPGGASQSLLERGVIVTGIDPAEMHPTLMSHPNFTHIRRRITQVQRREFRKIRWLTADMNVAPNYTLDAVEAIVTFPRVNIRGMLLTLKLSDWGMADSVPELLARVRGWGFNFTHARQLAHNRQEICVAALQKPFRRKPHHEREG
ncbi:MAG TPA: SAM-dependent methyltransferase [Thermoguttaceae bacterium]|nr:SAM-dependent methyltransferase [Thermoguttaceae bacterium]